MAWLMAHPINDTINRNFRPLRSINLYVTIVANSCTTAMKIDDPPADKCVPDFAMMIVPYVTKIDCAVNRLSSEKTIACQNPRRDFTEMKREKINSMPHFSWRKHIKYRNNIYRCLSMRVLNQSQPLLQLRWDFEIEPHNTWDRFVADVDCRNWTLFEPIRFDVFVKNIAVWTVQTKLPPKRWGWWLWKTAMMWYNRSMCPAWMQLVCQNFGHSWKLCRADHGSWIDVEREEMKR